MRVFRLRLPGRARPFRLFVTSDAPGAPPDRWFRSLDAALQALDALDADWKPAAWVIEYRENHGATVGGIPLVRNVVHIQHGQAADEVVK